MTVVFCYYRGEREQEERKREERKRKKERIREIEQRVRCVLSFPLNRRLKSFERVRVNLNDQGNQYHNQITPSKSI